MARNQKDQWAEMLKRLQVYQLEHNGSTEVPRGYRQDPQLGSWVNKQRHNYKTGLLSKERKLMVNQQTSRKGLRWSEVSRFCNQMDGRCMDAGFTQRLLQVGGTL